MDESQTAARAAYEEVASALLRDADTIDTLRLTVRSARVATDASVALVALTGAAAGTDVILTDPAGISLVTVLEPLVDAVVKTMLPLRLAGVDGGAPVLAVPLGTLSMTGAFVLERTRGSPSFTDDSTTLAQLFAAQAAALVERDHVANELAQLLAVRSRAGPDIPQLDAYVQSLFGIGMTLKAASAEAHDATSVRARLDSALDQIHAVAEALREYHSA